MKIHEIKIAEDYADAVLDGSKTFEIRRNDRGYQKGDLIKFIVIDRDLSLKVSEHGLNDRLYKITYVHSGLGMADGYVALSIEPKEWKYERDEYHEELQA